MAAPSAHRRGCFSVAPQTLCALIFGLTDGQKTRLGHSSSGPVLDIERMKTFMAQVRDMGLLEKAYVLAGVGPRFRQGR